MHFLREKPGGKVSVGRLLSTAIVMYWLTIAAATAAGAAYYGNKIQIIDFPDNWMWASMFFYAVTRLSREQLQAIVLRFLGMKQEKQADDKA